MLKKFIAITAISFAILFLLGLIRYFFGIESSTIIGCVIYYLFFIVCMHTQKKLGKLKVFLAVILGILILNVPLRITAFDSSIITLPEMVLYLISVLVSYMSYSVQNKASRYIVFFSYLSVVSIASLALYKYWFNYVNFGNFNEKLKKAENVIDIEVFTNENETQVLNSNGNILVLDFWNSECAACFEKFPALQKLSDKYSEKVDFYAINIPFRNERNKDIFKKISAMGYSFNTVIAKDSMLYKKLGVKVFPTTLIIDKNDNIIFRGDIESVGGIINKLLN